MPGPEKRHLGVLRRNRVSRSDAKHVHVAHNFEVGQSCNRVLGDTTLSIKDLFAIMLYVVVPESLAGGVWSKARAYQVKDL
jgi:hypothetical protein